MIDPNVPMAHSQVNEFLPSARAVPNSRNAMADSEVDDFDVGRFHAIRKEQKEQMMELQKSYQDRKDFIKKTIQAEQESLFNAFQQGMQSLYGSLVQQVATTIERQVTLRLDEEKLEEQHAAGKRDIERRYHHEASKVLSTPATRNSTQVPRASSSGSHTNSFLVSFVTLYCLLPQADKSSLGLQLRTSTADTDSFGDANAAGTASNSDQASVQ